MFCLSEGLASVYSLAFTHISSNVDREAIIDPPIQDEYFLYRSAVTLMSVRKEPPAN